jgi:hypothetical protein
MVGLDPTTQPRRVCGAIESMQRQRPIANAIDQHNPMTNIRRSSKSVMVGLDPTTQPRRVRGANDTLRTATGAPMRSDQLD